MIECTIKPVMVMVHIVKLYNPCKSPELSFFTAHEYYYCCNKAK